MCPCWWKHIHLLQMWHEIWQKPRPWRAKMCPCWWKLIHLLKTWQEIQQKRRPWSEKMCLYHLGRETGIRPYGTVNRMWMLTSTSGVYKVILCEKQSARHIQEILNRLQSYSLVQCLCYWKHIQRLKMWQEFSQNNRPGRAEKCPSWRKPIHLHSGHWTKMQTLRSINVHMLVKTHSPGPNLTRNLTILDIY